MRNFEVYFAAILEELCQAKEASLSAPVRAGILSFAWPLGIRMGPRYLKSVTSWMVDKII